MPYFAARSTFQKSIMQRIAVSMNDHVNALRAGNVLGRGHMCDPRVSSRRASRATAITRAIAAIALMAELAYPAMVSASHPAPAADCGQRRLFPPY